MAHRYHALVDSNGGNSCAEAAREFIRRMGRGDVNLLVDLTSERVRYTVRGHSPFAGAFRGREDVAAHLRRLYEATSGTLETLKLHDVLVGSEHVAALVTLGASGRGRVAHGRFVFLFAFDQDEAIDEIEVFFDDEGAMERYLSPR